MRRIEVIGLKYDREIIKGDSISEAIIEAIKSNGVSLRNGDIIVVTHKVISKAEGRVVDLNSVNPSERALEIARETGKDPRLVELILRESKEILKISGGHIIVLTRHGVVCANAGIDKSNAGGENYVVLLPEDPDRSAREIRDKVMKEFGVRVAVIVSDTYGRPFREGMVNQAIGFAGINPYRNYIGKPDRDGYIMRVTRIAIVDEVAGAAELVIGQTTENTPFAVVRGVDYEECNECSFKDLVMPKEKWLFQ
ncbi:MAG: coenzyme F420-0:L-glutamate ligase [Desulfurococcaceae archaeon]